MRYKFRNKVAMRRNKKRKEDMSWAAELLNYRNNVVNKQHEPSPLHLVTKIKPMYGRPKSEKETLMSLGFTSDVSGLFFFSYFFIYYLLKRKLKFNQ